MASPCMMGDRAERAGDSGDGGKLPGGKAAPAGPSRHYLGSQPSSYLLLSHSSFSLRRPGGYP